MLRPFKSLNQWGFTLVIVLLAGAVSLWRFWLGPVHVAEEFPWGFSAALNIFCGLALATGGFAIAATLLVLRVEHYRPLLRASMFIAYFGYAVALAAAFFQYRWHWEMLWSLWSPKAIPAGAGIAFLLYSVVLIAEFLPDASRIQKRPLIVAGVRYTGMLLTCIAAMLAGLQQVSFVRLLYVAPGSFSSIWVTAMLPVQLYLTAVCGALAVLVVVCWQVAIRREKAVSEDMFDSIGRALLILLLFSIGVRVLDVTDSGQWHNLLHSHFHDYLFGLELVLLIAPAIFLLARSRDEHRMVYDSSLMIIAGFLVNRLNIAITSREAIVGKNLVPDFSEAVVALAIIAAAVGIVSWITKRVPLFA